MSSPINETPILTTTAVASIPKPSADDIFDLNFDSTPQPQTKSNDLLVLNGGGANPFLQNLVTQSYNSSPYQQQPSAAVAQNPFAQMPNQMGGMMMMNTNSKMGKYFFHSLSLST